MCYSAARTTAIARAITAVTAHATATATAAGKRRDLRDDCVLEGDRDDAARSL